ncbi:hypothetical protein M4D79_10760 [Mycolicibacterium novocastrense]|nr:hypothetical protein M4D79_10760 [Mycolicibacterium novocastrense]
MKSSLAVDIRRFRYFSITLASSAALALTVMSAGAPTTLAQPTDTTYPTESTYAPAEEAPAEVPAYEAPTYEAPSQMPVPAAPEPPIQAPVVTPEAPAPVVTEAPVETQPPVVTDAPVVPEETQAPEVVTTAAPEVTAEPEPRTTAPAATPAPSTTATTQATAPTPATTTAAPGATTEATAPAGSSAAKTSPSPTTSPPEESTADPTLTTDPQSTSELAPAGGGSTDPSSVIQSAELAAGVTTTPEPQRLEASPQNIEIAQQAAPVREDPPPAPAAEINRLRDLVVPVADPGAAGAPGVAADPAVAANYRVMQWQPNWVQYDQYFRPLIFNPYPEPLQLVYEVAGVPRILLIPRWVASSPKCAISVRTTSRRCVSTRWACPLTSRSATSSAAATSPDRGSRLHRRRHRCAPSPMCRYR